MAKKKKESMEFRFYEIPQGEPALILFGESWVRVYGHDFKKLHFHNLMEIGICRYGAGVMEFTEESHRYEDGTITVIPENMPHITISDGEDNNFWEYIFIDLKPFVEELFPEKAIYQKKVLEVINSNFFIGNVSNYPLVERYINDIIDEGRNKNLFYKKIIKMKICELILEMMRNDNNIPTFDSFSPKGSNMAQITLALDYINKNYAEEIRAADLADICGMSETHFRRIFDSYINMPPMDYVNLIRIQKACDLMKKSNEPMDIIALKCGFASTSTFNRNFKKFLGTSPYQWKINPKNYENKILNFRISALKGW